MVKSEDIVKLYSAVLQKQKDQFDVDEDHIITGIKDINATYKPYKRWIARLDSPSTNYDDPAHRCAYLHKHAMIHTGLLCAVLELAMWMYPVKEVMNVDCVKLCSLGSGHGTDIVGCLLFLKEKFGTKRISTTLVDCYEGWKFVFDTIVSELKSEEFKDFNHIVTEENFDYEYVPSDLLKFDDSARLLFQRIANTDFITMVKFVSAAACRDTRRMVKVCKKIVLFFT